MDFEIPGVRGSQESSLRLEALHQWVDTIRKGGKNRTIIHTEPDLQALLQHMEEYGSAPLFEESTPKRIVITALTKTHRSFYNHAIRMLQDLTQITGKPKPAEAEETYTRVLLKTPTDPGTKITKRLDTTFKPFDYYLN